MPLISKNDKEIIKDLIHEIVEIKKELSSNKNEIERIKKENKDLKERLDNEIKEKKEIILKIDNMELKLNNLEKHLNLGCKERQNKYKITNMFNDSSSIIKN